MKVISKTIEYQTREKFDLRDITDEVKKFMVETGVKNGLVNIQLLHTTCGLMLNENEPLLIEDIKKNLEKTSPETLGYEHDDFSKRTVNMCSDECANGHSHCQAIHLPPSLALNIIDGVIQLGRWQRIMFIELDRSRPRKVQVQVIGE